MTIPVEPYGPPATTAEAAEPKRNRRKINAVLLVILVVLVGVIIWASTLGGGSAKPEPAVAPSTVGDTLPDAEAELKAAHFAYVEHPLGDTLFGIVQPHNWIVCDQVKLDGRKIRLDASNKSCPN